jgi:hypothetical protein
MLEGSIMAAHLLGTLRSTLEVGRENVNECGDVKLTEVARNSSGYIL